MKPFLFFSKKSAIIFTCFIAIILFSQLKSFSQGPGGITAKLWYRADRGVSPATGTVTTWTDQSSGVVSGSLGLTLPVVTAATSTTFNFNPGITFTSANAIGIVAAQNLVTVTNYDIYTVTKEGLTSDRIFNMNVGTLTGGSSFDQPGIGVVSTAVRDNTGTLIYYAAPNPPAFSTTTTSIMQHAFTSTTLIRRLNGAAAGTTTSIGTTNTTPTGGVLFGQSTGATGISGDDIGFGGTIGETIVFNKTLAAAEINKVNTYLAIKYGITLNFANTPNYISSNGTTVWAGDAVYQYNIAGISRDDLSVQNQKQSKSINANTNGQIVIGLGTIAADNASNINTFNNDKSFLISADNNVTTSLAAANTTFTYNGFSNNKRMNRIWKISNSGSSQLLQAVKIQFPIASVGTITLTSEGVCAKYVLIASTDPTFATGVTSTVLITNGANYEATTKFPSGVSYFTFAKVNQEAAGNVILNHATTPNVNVTDVCLRSVGWKYYYYDAGKTQKAFAINWTGATEGTSSGNLTYNVAHYNQTSGVYQCRIMGRLWELISTGASFGSGISVRIFFDSTELTSSIVPGVVSQRWFKYSGNAAATIAANNGQSVVGALYLTPSATGSEDGINYVEFNNITGFSTFGFASNSGPFLLPVSLVSFNVMKNGNASKLNWATANEQNTKEFIIERATNGNNYTPIGSVDASINSNRTQNYSFTDNAPATGTNYYRLKMVDKDGSFIYSPIKILNFDGANTIVIYPDPAEDMLTITGVESGMQLRLIAVDGRILSTQLAKGNTETMHVHQLSSGIYVIQAIKNGAVVNAVKFSKK